MRRRRSLPTLAPMLVLVLGLAAASLVAMLGFLQMRADGDAAVALRSQVLARALAERLRATPERDRTLVVERAARRSGVELILVEQSGRIVVDGSLGAPTPEGVVDLLVEGSGEVETRSGRKQFHAQSLGHPLEHLSLLTFAPSPDLPPEARALLLSVLALTALLVGAAVLVTYTFARDVHADLAYVRERIRQMAREGTSPSGMAVPVRDTDQVGVLTSAFNQLVDRFTAAEHAYRHDLAGADAFDRDRSAFLAALSHELRTPLNAILGFTDVLLAEVDGPLGDDARENLTVLRRSADHLRALIDDILDLSALESGELRLEIGPVDVFSVAAEVAREARVTAEAKDLRVTLSGRSATAWADARRVRQILWNLVGNAVKYTRTGRIDVSVDLRGDSVVASVADTGPGIPPEQRAAIFEEYWQAPSTRQARTGAGLGLAITRRLVRMHGGRIELDSEIGRGSEFRVVLPVNPETREPPRFISSVPPPIGSATGEAAA